MTEPSPSSTSKGDSALLYLLGHKSQTSVTKAAFVGCLYCLELRWCKRNRSTVTASDVAIVQAVEDVATAGARFLHSRYLFLPHLGRIPTKISKFMPGIGRDGSV